MVLEKNEVKVKREGVGESLRLGLLLELAEEVEEVDALELTETERRLPRMDAEAVSRNVVCEDFEGDTEIDFDPKMETEEVGKRDSVAEVICERVLVTVKVILLAVKAAEGVGLRLVVPIEDRVPRKVEEDETMENELNVENWVVIAELGVLDGKIVPEKLVDCVKELLSVPMPVAAGRIGPSFRSRTVDPSPLSMKNKAKKQRQYMYIIFATIN